MRKVTALFSVCVFCLLFSPGVAAAEWVGVNSPTPTEPEVTLVSHTSAATVLDVTVHGFYLEEIEEGGVRYHGLAFGDHAALREIGRPQLPVVSRMVGIPDLSDYQVSVEVLESSTYDGYHVYPAQQPLKDGQPAPPFTLDADFYGRDTEYPAMRAVAGEPQIWRDLRLTRLELRPLGYNPVREELTVISRMRVTLTYSGINPVRRFTRVRHPINPRFQQLYRSAVINFDRLEYQITDRATDSPGTRYLVVTTDEALPYVQELAEFRDAQGYEVEVRTLEPGFETDTQIKAYINQLYLDYGLEYVLLVGDAYYSGGQVDVPMHMWVDSYSDSWYTMMDGGGDYLADLAIGRFVYDSLAELQHQMDKTMGYLTAPEVSDWAEHTLLVAHSEQYPQKYTECKEEIRNYPYAEQVPIFGTAYGGAGATNNDVIDYLNTYSSGILNYRGHGSQTAWSSWGPTGDFNASHIAQLTNDDRLFVHFDVCCDNMDFPGTSGNCFAEAMMKADAAAVAVHSAIIPSYTIPNHDYDKEFYRAIYDLGLHNIGDAQNFANIKVYEDHGSLGESNIRTYLWLGDASIDAWTASMGTLPVSHPGAMMIGTGSLMVSAGVEGALVCAQNDEIYASGYTDASGSITLTFASAPVVPDNLTITVSSHNYLTYQEDIPIIPPEGPYVVYELHALDDDDSGYSSGNGDGVATPGETIELELGLKNFGVATAYGVTATVSSPSAHIQFSDDSAAYGDVAPDQSVMNPDPIVFQVLSSCPHSEVVQFDVDITDGVDLWESTFFFVVEAGQLVLQSHVMTDYPEGNNDGDVDMGESVYLELVLENVGAVLTTNVSATLTSNDPGYVTVLEGTADYPDIPAGGSASSESQYYVAVDLSTPCGTTLSFDLNVSTDQGAASDTLELKLGGTAAQYEWNLDTDPGWSVEGMWAFGQPTGQGGYSYGFPDPDSGATGLNVYGYNLQGDYSTDVGGPYHVTTGAIDCSGVTEVVLQFQRWLNSDYPSYVYQVIEVSSDGVNWQQIYQNPDYEFIEENSWTEYEYDLSAVADNEPTVYLRWGHEVGSTGAYAFSGWNIDDIRIIGVDCQPWYGGGGDTVAVDIACVPGSGELPFATTIGVEVQNLTSYLRRMAGQIQVQVAAGGVIEDFRSGTLTLAPFSIFTTSWPQMIPAHPAVVGNNFFLLEAEDVTPSPYNQPPYPPSGDTDTALCTVTGVAP